MDIPDGAFRYGTHSYYIFDRMGLASWEEARDFCEALGGYLAVIGTSEENEMMFRFMKSSGVNEVFIGYSDSGNEGTWKWVSQEASDFVNWYPGKPDQKEQGNYCMIPVKNADGTANENKSWQDAQFIIGQNDAFICEWSTVE